MIWVNIAYFQREKIAAFLKLAMKSSLLVFLSVYASYMFAQVPVRDSSSNPSPVSTSSQASPSIFEIQTLQQEILELRGLLEEQNHQIKRLKQQRLDDYLDLDKRLLELGQKIKSQPTPNSTSSGVLPISSADIGATSTDVSSAESSDLYNQAIDLLLNKQDYAGAQGKFDTYIERFPQGSFIPNILYWKGQIFFANDKKAEAENMYQQLVESYPSHSKAPDAKFKLAKLYFEQGKKTEAKVILDEIAASDTDAALLAKSFLSNNYSQ